MTTELSVDDQEFLARCEEELKDRYTENDEDFMRVYKSEPSKPPVIDSWWVPNNSGRRNDNRDNRRHHPYERHGGNNWNRDRGHNRDFDNREQGYRQQRHRYQY